MAQENLECLHRGVEDCLPVWREKGKASDLPLCLRMVVLYGSDIGLWSLLNITTHPGLCPRSQSHLSYIKHYSIWCLRLWSYNNSVLPGLLWKILRTGLSIMMMLILLGDYILSFRLSPTYKKVVFREYNKDFKQAKSRPPWLGKRMFLILR